MIATVIVSLLEACVLVAPRIAVTVWSPARENRWLICAMPSTTSTVPRVRPPTRKVTCPLGIEQVAVKVTTAAVEVAWLWVRMVVVVERGVTRRVMAGRPSPPGPTARTWNLCGEPFGTGTSTVVVEQVRISMGSPHVI